MPSLFLPEPLAYFLTWTAYGSWLPGDIRGWTDGTGSTRSPNARLERQVQSRIRRPAVTLSPHQRDLVAQVITCHCNYRSWTLYALACRAQHVHVVVRASGSTPVIVAQQFKAWASRALHSGGAMRDRIWTHGQSMRRLYDERSLAAVIEYVRDGQDRPRSEYRSRS